MYIYKTTNLVNGKIYIGQSTYESAGSVDYMGSGTTLEKAFKKYGKHNFKKEILIDNVDPLNLNQIEIQLIAEYNARDKSIGYNIERGGGGHSYVSRKKISDSISAIIKTEQYISKLSNAMKRPEVKEKLKGQYNSDSIPWNAGKTDVYSDETIEKMRQSAIDRTISDETEMERRRKISEYQQQNNPIRKGVLDNDTGIEYKSIAEYCEKTNTSWYKTKRYRIEGKITIK